MATLYEMIGIDAGSGIDQTEVEAIKRVLTRIQAKLAELAKDNPAHTTLMLLQEVEEVVWKVVSENVHSPKELRAALGRIDNAMPTPLGDGGSGDGGSGDGGSFRTADFNENLKNVLLSHEGGVSPGQMKLIGRTLGMAGAGERIDPTADGTPAELATTRNARDDFERKFEEAQQKLADERDERKSGSLAHQLKEASQERDRAELLAEHPSDDDKAIYQAAKKAFDNKRVAAIGGGYKLSDDQAASIKALLDMSEPRYTS